VPAAKVSILLCVYNAARTLQEAVDSILAQSFGDFELVIVDDGSTDGSAQLLAAHHDTDQRVYVPRARALR
jgi:glycosyltransferase involved in cell wall biosynthesis